MAKKLKRTLALTMVLCMLTSVLPMQVLAADSETTTETVTDGGLTTEITTTTTTTTDEETGNVTVTIEIQQNTSGETEDGAVVESESSDVSTTVSDSEGKVIESASTSETTSVVEKDDEATITETTTEASSGTTEDGVDVTREETTTTTTNVAADGTTTEQTVTDGSEKKEWTEDVQPGDEVPDVTVTLTPGETVTESSKETTVKGEIDSEEGQTTTTVDREVTVDTGNITVTESQIADFGMNSIAPEDYEGKENILIPGSGVSGANSDAPISGNRDIGLYDVYEVKDENGNVVEVRYYVTTWRNQAEYDVLPDEIKALYKKDGGKWKPIDEDGNIKEKAGYISETKNGGQRWDYILGGQGEKSTSGTLGGDSKSQFVLYDRAGNRTYAYCMDSAIGTFAGWCYTLENLEEATYFQGTEEEQADAKAHVRAIALNGYWGTEDGTGSLKNLTEGLTEALDNGYEFVYSYTENGVTYAYDSRTEEGKQQILDLLVANLNEGDALVATQASFWDFGRDNRTEKKINSNSPEAKLRMELIKSYLISDYLKDKVAADETAQETTIIDNDSFLAEDGVQLTVKDQVTDHAANQDENKDNDVYNTDLSFTMEVEPSTANGDDLVVTLRDSNGKVIAKARLAGEAKEDESWFTKLIKKDKTYTFENLPMSENSDLTFDLKLEGIQYLEEGVYMYKCVAGYDKVQTLVGVSEGEKEVSVNAKFTLNFNVDEEKHITTQRVWHDESDPIVTVPEQPEQDDNGPVPMVFRLNNQNAQGNLQEIEEEPVPLASPAVTGDGSVLWIALILLSAFGIAAVNLQDKKRRSETF